MKVGRAKVDVEREGGGRKCWTIDFWNASTDTLFKLTRSGYSFLRGFLIIERLYYAHRPSRAKGNGCGQSVFVPQLHKHGCMSVVVSARHKFQSPCPIHRTGILTMRPLAAITCPTLPLLFFFLGFAFKRPSSAGVFSPFTVHACTCSVTI